jgi:hypothetical protein
MSTNSETELIYKKMNNNPVFILSLPRSGSTLLQRYLMTSKNIVSTSETWLLLSLYYSISSEGIKTEYNQKKLTEATADFFENISIDKNLYLKKITDFYFSLYQNHPDFRDKIIIEKTPRYSLIANDLIKAMPNAKFIFLWRDPIDIVMSMNKTWSNGRWNTHNYYVDLFKGMATLIATYKINADNEKIISINYDTFINSEDERKRLLAFLDINDAEDSKINEVNLKGKMGDKKGQEKFTKITAQNTKIIRISIFRFYWFKKYYKFLNKNHFEEITEVNLTSKEFVITWNPKLMIIDAFDFLKGKLYLLFEHQVFLDKFRKTKKRGILA